MCYDPRISAAGLSHQTGIIDRAAVSAVPRDPTIKTLAEVEIMFEINRRPMITEVRCRECRAALEINTDHRPLIARSIAYFERHHECITIPGKDAHARASDNQC